MTIKNNFWTIIEDSYYRIHDGVLKYAPIGDNNIVLLSQESHIEVISAEMLELINYEFNSNFDMSDF